MPKSKFKSFFFTLLYLLVCFTSVYADGTDSLWQLLNDRQGAVHYETRQELTKKLNAKPPETALLKVRTWLRQAQRKQQADRIADGLYLMAEIYADAGNDSAQTYFRMAADKASTSRQKVAALSALGKFYFDQSVYDSAFNYFMEALPIAEEGDMPDLLSSLYIRIGNNYLREGVVQKSRVFYEKAYVLNSELGDKIRQARTLMSVGNTEYYTGDIDSAVILYRRAVRMIQGTNEAELLANTYSNIGSFFIVTDNSDSSSLYFESAAAVYDSIGDIRGMTRVFYNSALGYRRANRLDLAALYLERADTLAKEAELRDIQLGILQLRAEIMAQQGYYDTAYAGMLRYNRLREELVNDRILENQQELTTKYETAKKQAEIERLEGEQAIQQVLLVAILIILFLAVIIATVLYKANKRRKAANRLLTQQRDEIENQKVEISINNEELLQQKEEIETQRDELQAVNTELGTTVRRLRRTQRQLVEAEKMAALGQLTSGVAHEVNTPVGIGITAASHVRDITKHFAKQVSDRRIRRHDLVNYMRDVYDSNKLLLNNLVRAAELIERFRDVGLSSEDPSAIQPLEVKEYIEIAYSLEERLSQDDVKLQINVPRPVIIETDPHTLNQIIAPIIENIAEHAFIPGEEGLITADLEQDDERTYVIISDNGRGIDPDDLQRIFDPFFVGGKQRKGSGLGLHIVYNLVTYKLNGTIECRSEVGIGTRVIITLPQGRKPHSDIDAENDPQHTQ